MEEGYCQAIENLAYQITRHTSESITPIFDKHPEILESGNIDDIINMCESHLSYKQLSVWSKMNEILVVICEEYSVNFEDAFVDLADATWKYTASTVD